MNTDLYSFSSTAGIVRLTSAERSALVLSREQSEILFGILISDGTIERRSPTANSRFLFAQSAKHDAFFFDVFNLFSSFCTATTNP
ncbi:MAG: hypothetical protein O7C56_07550 [Rickettsia endosymbiont of Ixodes persulcatus]|nr:hypothetical protein [Rickettsia endosymbiont of Ixodes persulcatus]